MKSLRLHSPNFIHAPVTSIDCSGIFFQSNLSYINIYIYILTHFIMSHEQTGETLECALSSGHADQGHLVSLHVTLIDNLNRVYVLSV